MISKAFFRKLKINFNEPIEIQFNKADSNKIEFAEEFLACLEQVKDANLLFSKLTTGLKRSLNYYIVSAKS
jgi:uncharacterized protein YdeI (YjbR/CyaY-like superfamily)